MNKKGQALILFIVLIPVFFVITAILVDLGINTYYEKKINNISEDIVFALLDNDDLKTVTYENEEEVREQLMEEAIMLYDLNEINTDNLSIEMGYGSEFTFFNTYDHYSFMNSLFGRGNGKRQISVKIDCSIENGEKIIEFKDGSNED